MTIFVTGATGTVGSQVVAQLADRGARIRALVRNPQAARLPESVEIAKGDLLDVESVRSALNGVRTLFLLNAVSPDELTQAMIALNLAREAAIERIVYLSVIHSDIYADVPHFAGKYAVERMIERTGLAATILRPAYFINNDASLQEAVQGHGVYPMPIGAKGLAMIDVRDIGEIAAIELLKRDQAPEPLPFERIDLVGPERLTGSDVAGIWSDVLGRPIAYGGDDTAAFERMMARRVPSWMAYDTRIMADRFQSEGMAADAGTAERLAAMLGRPLRSYREFATEAAAQWRRGTPGDAREQASRNAGKALA
jgi:uncharacterized protein YbjT (DUF2867 family)